MSTSWVITHQWGNPLISFRPSSHFLPVLQSARGLTVIQPICCKTKVLNSVSNIDTVVATDDNCGHKEVISVNPRLYDYLLANVREPEILRELREETATMRILGAERCIEVGVYTGYSSLAVALVLPEGGQLVACERDAKSLEVAQRYYDRAGVSNKVNVKHGLAADTLKSMIQNGEGNSYDFAFVDAEKKMYQDYFELLLQLVNDSKTLSIRSFNRKLMEDNRVSISMIVVDGCCKDASAEFPSYKMCQGIIGEVFVETCGN
ncbi:hypothetical protein DH2020_006009 [Rehmannia glutinosa]|uniref:Caffeoyl-CoA O-methyltransferase n=1 Tax=Rehmannia glutinosa TaxID=99300 RepID=A0ABR0XHM2_REHGL